MDCPSQKNQGYISAWHNQLATILQDNGIPSSFIFDGVFQLLIIEGYSMVIHLIDIENDFYPKDLITLQEKFILQNVKLVHLWEDVWISKSKQTLSRLRSLLNLNKRIHGRKTEIRKITKPISDSFLHENHLQGAVSSRYKLGLFFKGELVGVATFSALRKMKHTENYQSAELIRFAIKAGYSVTGGLSKLILSFRKWVQPDDIMTYADRDWSTGEAYVRLGFQQTDNLKPQVFFLNSEFNRQLKKEDSKMGKEVFNTGSLKFILRFSNERS